MTIITPNDNINNKTYRFLAAKVSNISKGCILLRKFVTTNAWTLPLVKIPVQTSDPLYYLENLMQTISGNYKVVGAINIFQFDWNVNNDHHIYHVYDLTYEGKIEPQLTEKVLHYFSDSGWKFPYGIAQIEKKSPLLMSFIQKGM